MSRFLIPFAVSFAVPLVFSVFRRWAPRDRLAETVNDDGRRLPYGVAGACMWFLGVLIAFGGFFLLRLANRVWGSLDHQATLSVYPVAAIWAFLPGFAALTLPWLTTLWLMRRFGYAVQAAEIVAKGNEKMNLDGERVMHGLTWGVVLPVGLLTVMAIPMHLAVTHDEVRVTHYAHLSPEIFPFADARRAFSVDGNFLRDGRFQSHPDLVLCFADGRRLSANAVGDGGSTPSKELVDLLLGRTGLEAVHVKTVDEVRDR
jgi:MFS family permease